MLVVDDDDDTREIYAWCMRAAGWVVMEAADGAEALDLARQFEPDVIVMDLRLPVVAGLDAIRSLRAEEETWDVPIVAVSAFDPSASEVEARQAGCDVFLAKPCEPEALRERIEELVTRRADPSGAPSR